MNIKSKKNSDYVRGITILNHRKRMKLGLGIIEYVFIHIFAIETSFTS